MAIAVDRQRARAALGELVVAPNKPHNIELALEQLASPPPNAERRMPILD